MKKCILILKMDSADNPKRRRKLKNNRVMLTLLFAIYTLIELTFWFVVSWIVLAVCYPFDKARKAVHWCSKMICMFFWKAPFTWKQRVIGLENIDKNKSYVIAINHQSMVDIVSLYFLPLNFRWVSKQEVFRMPYIGPMLIAHGDIPIKRGRAAESMKKVINDGKMWISRGASIAIFPEGTRSKDGEIHNFKAGAFILAKDAGVPILPIVLDGTNTMVHKGWLVNWRNKITIRILPAIPAEEVQNRDIKDVMSQVREDMVDTLAEMRKNK